MSSRRLKILAICAAAIFAAFAALLTTSGSLFLLRLVPGLGPLTESWFTQPVETVRGPESPGLRTGLEGCVIYEVNERPGELLALDTVSIGDDRRGHKTWPVPDGYIHALAGPDSHGHVAVIEDRLFSAPPRHLLKVVSLSDESVTVLFDHPGAALFTGPIGGHVALSPVNDLIAVVTDLAPQQMRSPDLHLHEGTLEVWDVASQRRIHTLVGVVDDLISWFPDGKRLAVTQMVPRRALTPRGSVDTFGAWDRVPVVSVWDFTSVEAVSVGWHATVASDGETVVFSGHADDNQLLHLSTGQVERIDWPGKVRPLALGLLGRRVVYRGLATEGTKSAWTRFGSPLVSNWQLVPVKVADIDDRRFLTLTDAFDPRSALSYGPGPCSQ